LLAANALSAEQVHNAAMKARPEIATSAAFDPAGRLWRVRVADGHVVVDHSDNLAIDFSAPLRVTRQAENVSANGELRPEIAVRGDHIYVAWTTALAAPYSGNIRFARSHDGGKSFEP